MPRPKKSLDTRYNNAAGLYNLVKKHFPKGELLPIHRCMMAYDFSQAEADNLSFQQRVRRISAAMISAPGTKAPTTAESGLSILAQASLAQASLTTPKAVVVDATVTDININATLISPLSDRTNKRKNKELSPQQKEFVRPLGKPSGDK